MIIPDFVKIKGKRVFVYQSPRGYVEIGESVADIKRSNDSWEDKMYGAFLEALRKEKKRLK
ncbi:MAG: hypothetical protein ACOCV1_03070 [Bacillota bacterium]